MLDLRDRIFQVSVRPIAAKLAIFGFALGIAGCSTPPPGVDVHDPYESVNRVTNGFNTALDTAAFRPASRVYGKLIPSPVRSSLDNAAGNLGLPSAVLNKTLQGDVEDAVHNFARFAVNTTLGLFGLFDPAADFGLEERGTDFGRTLQSWDVQEGAYLVLPIVGPSTERAAVGTVVDAVTNPIGIFFGPETSEARVGASFTEILNYRYLFQDTIDSILYDSADPYAQLRLFYLDSSRFDASGPVGAEAYEDLYDDLIFQ